MCVYHISKSLDNICTLNKMEKNTTVTLVVNTSRSFPYSQLITGFVTRLTRRVPLVEQELLTLPEHLSSPPVLVGSCYSIFSFICVFCRSLFVLLCLFFRSLCCLFFFDIRFLIAPLVSSNSYKNSFKIQWNNRRKRHSNTWLLTYSWLRPITHSNSRYMQSFL